MWEELLVGIHLREQQEVRHKNLPKYTRSANYPSALDDENMVATGFTANLSPLKTSMLFLELASNEYFLSFRCMR